MKLHITKAHQIKHARCKKSLPLKPLPEEIVDPTVRYEVKEDGLRYFLQIRPNRSLINYLTSRHKSVDSGLYVEKQDRVPMMRNFKFPRFAYNSILDGEIVGGKLSSDTQHAMVGGEVHFVCWDIILLNGTWVKDQPLSERWKLLKEFLEKCSAAYWIKPATYFNLYQPAFAYVEQNDKEGLVKKDLTKPYGEGWTKMKREQTYDCVIWGYEDTNSEEWNKKGWIGALKIGQWKAVPKKEALKRGTILAKQSMPKPGEVTAIGNRFLKFIDCGKCSGMTQDQRDMFSTNKGTYIGHPVEIECQLRLPSMKFRHPRFMRLRADKDGIECRADRD